MNGILLTMTVLTIILKSVALNSNHLVKPVNSGSGNQKGCSRDGCLCSVMYLHRKVMKARAWNQLKALSFLCPRVDTG